MKNVLRFAVLAVLCLLYTGASRAQGHQAILTWTLSVDDNPTNCPTTGSTCDQAMYSMKNICPAVQPTTTAGFNLVSATIAPTATTFTDTSIPPGAVCYVATFTLNGQESGPSNTAGGIIKPKPPTGLGVTQIAGMIQIWNLPLPRQITPILNS